MKFCNFLLLTVLATSLDFQTIDASAHNLYAKSIDHNHPQAAQRLTQESFINPEMQWAVLSFMGYQNMVIDVATGQVDNMPTLDMVLAKVNQQLIQQQTWTSAQKESAKNALHALLDATETAAFVASVEKVYQDQNVAGYQNVAANVTMTLDGQKQAINNSLAAVNAKIVSDGQSSSYFSWIPYFGSSSNSAQPAQISSMSIPVPVHAKTVSIPAQLMPTIVKTNNYKEMPDSVQASNLLFKQCFIAQQHHLKDMYRLNSLKINLQGQVNASNYIFTNFPDIYNKYSNSYPICDVAQQIVASSPARYNINSPLSVEQQQAHILLLHIRQAIQTAMYIANKKSSYNVGYLFSSSMTSYLDGILSQLMLYDKQLAILCKDPMYGATPQDLEQATQWLTVSNIATGIAVTAAVIGTVHLLAPTVLPGAATYISNTTAGSYVAGAAKSLVPSTVSNWLSSSTPATTSTAQTAAAAQQSEQPAPSTFTNNERLQMVQTEIANLENQKKKFSSGYAPNSTQIAQIDRKIADYQNIKNMLHSNTQPATTQLQTVNNLVNNAVPKPVQGPVTADGKAPVAPSVGWMPSLFGSKQPAAGVTNTQPETTDKPVTWTDRASQAWNMASSVSAGAAAIGGAFSVSSQALKMAENNNLVEQGTYNNLTGGYGQQIERAANTAAVVGGTISGFNYGYGTWANWWNPQNTSYLARFWNTIDLIKATPGFISSAVTAGAFAANQFSGLISQQQQMLQQSQNNPQSQSQQLPPQQIYQAFTNMMQDAPAQGQDPFVTLIEGIQLVGSNNMTDQQTLFTILQKLQQDNASNPDLANKINQLTASLAQDLQGQQIPAAA